MSDLPGFLSDLNPLNNKISGLSALNLTANILDNYDLTGLQPIDILSSLHDANISISAPDFYSIYDDITGSKTRYQRIRFVNLDKTPSEGILEPSRYQLPTRYRIVHNMTYEDTETGAIITREYITDTNVLGTIDDMQQDAIDRFESQYPVSVIEISTSRGYINAGI